MDWILFAIEFGIIAVATPIVVLVLGTVLSINPPTIPSLIARSLITAIIFAGGMALWVMVPLNLGILNMLVPIGLLMVAAFSCWGHEFPDESVYALSFALIVGVVRFGALLLLSGLMG